MSVFEEPWVEKYRPKTLDEIVGNEDAVRRFKAIAANGNLPNVILSGPPGTGKTTTVTCLARALLGSAAKRAVLELNASDDRGIQIVRERIKLFAQRKVVLPEGRHKLIILDEADSMTPAAQEALRRTMELHSATTRFALACNDASKIIEPIQSRCALIRFAPVPAEAVAARLIRVLNTENVGYTPAGLDALITVAQGDLRSCLNAAQAAASYVSLDLDDEDVQASGKEDKDAKHAGPTKTITDGAVYAVCDMPHPQVIRSCIMAAVSGRLDQALSLVDGLLSEGYSAAVIISSLYTQLMDNTSSSSSTVTFAGTSVPQAVGAGLEDPSFVLSDSKRVNILKNISECHLRIARGNTSKAQIHALVASLMV